jgi:predicted NUDIX family NTP pyrophosphohydrolase
MFSKKSFLLGESHSKKGCPEFDSGVCKRIGQMHHALNVDVANWFPLTVKTTVYSSQTMFLNPLNEKSIVILPMAYYRIWL